MSATEAQRTAEHWSTEGAWEIGRGLYWLELPAVQRRLNQKVSGQAEVDWVCYTLEHHLGGRLPLDRCLSLGCGEGELERRLAGLGAFVECDAIDVSHDSVAAATGLAREAGWDHIHYMVQDANQMELPVCRFDAVWAAGAVHHFERLEHVFEQVAAALKPGGLFILSEYVGPSRFQFPERQRQVIQACHDLLPADCRRPAVAALQHHRSRRSDWKWLVQRVGDKVLDGDLAGAIWRRLQRIWSTHTGLPPVRTKADLPTARSVRAVDPSEAVRSGEILPLLRGEFEIVDFRPLGGSILQFLLADIAGNFLDGAGEGLLQMLFVIEDALMACGALESDFAYVVAAPRNASEQSEVQDCQDGER